MNNSIAQIRQRPKFSVAITTEGYKNLINNTLVDPERAKRFIAAITSAVAINPALQECDAGTILAGALLGESLNLSPSPQLGQYYLVPFKCKATYDKSGNQIEGETSKAQFILGYKGYMQLAVRSGQIKKLAVLEIKQGELKHFDPIDETIDCSIIEDWDKREATPTIGYYAMFETVNGYRKAIYWSKKQMMNHADKFSKAFSASAFEKIQKGEIPDKDMWKYSSFWYKDFDGMAKKTMLRQLISKGGCPMSTDLQMAFENDSSMVEFGKSNDLIATPEEKIELAPLEAQSDNEKAPEKIDINNV